MNSNFSLGQKIREFRIQKGLSQEQVALGAEITPAYLGLIERGVKNPTVAIVSRICISLNLPMYQLFLENVTYEQGEQALDELSAQILGQLESCTSEEKIIILNIIKNILKLQSMKNR